MSANVIPQSRPRRLLAIDGGGLLGLIPAEALIQIEKQLDDLTGISEPLCNRFDLIGGTSTGAILAAGLALGLKATELRDFYLNFGRDIFTKTLLPVRFWHSYPSGPLEKHLKDVFKDTTLCSDKLRTQILIVAKNATLGNDWFFTNNPRNRFFQQNSQLPLWQLVRCSSAAPTYFPPETMTIPAANGAPAQTYEFIDGGMSSYNNPSLQVFLEATIPAYGHGWPMGTAQLLLMSLGTGFNSVTIAEGKAAHYELIDWGRYVVGELMNEANLQQNVLMHLIGERPPTVPSATSELTLSGAASGVPDDSALSRMGAFMGAKKLVTYQRITVGLTRQRLDGWGLTDIDPVKVREMDAADQIANMQRIGEKVAEEQVHMELLRKFF